MARASCNGCRHLTTLKQLRKAYTGRRQIVTVEKCLYHDKHFLGGFAKYTPEGCYEGGKE